MVVSSTLSFLAVNNKLGDLTKGQLVEMAMENERRVGAPDLSISFSWVCLSCSRR